MSPAPYPGETQQPNEWTPRLIVGAIVATLTFGTLFWQLPLFVLIATAAAAAGTWEVSSPLIPRSGQKPAIAQMLPEVSLIASVLLGPGMAWFYPQYYLYITAAAIFIAMLFFSKDWGSRCREPIPPWLVGLGPSTYVAVPLGLPVWILHAPNGTHHVFRIIAVAVATDILAIAAGKSFGPRAAWLGYHPYRGLSPHKTVAGAIGGAVGGAVIPAAVVYWFLQDHSMSLSTGIVIGLVGSIAAQIGDLLASYLKRTTGLDDFSPLLPGHGGLMDRLDSIIGACIALAACYYYLGLV